MGEIKKQSQTLGLQVLSEVQTALGDDYKSLTDEQRLSIRDTAAMMMELELRQEAGEDVTEKLQAVESTVKDWKVWGQLGLESAFWKGVQKVASTIGTFLAAFATEAIGRIVPGL